MVIKSVEINGERLDYNEVLAQARALSHDRGATGQPLEFAQRAAYENEALEILIDRTLLVQEGTKLGLVPAESELEGILEAVDGRYNGGGCRVDALAPESRDDLRRRLIVERVLKHWRLSIAVPKGEEVRLYYKKRKESFYKPEMVHASHFVRACLADQQDAEVAQVEVKMWRERVLAGDSFSALAAAYSDCPENAGDLGWFPRGVMVEEFDAVIFGSPVNELTPVFRTIFGFHFAKVHGRRPEGIQPLNEVREEAARQLWLVKQDREVGRHLKALREQARISVEQ